MSSFYIDGKCARNMSVLQHCFWRKVQSLLHKFYLTIAVLYSLSDQIIISMHFWEMTIITSSAQK